MLAQAGLLATALALPAAAEPRAAVTEAQALAHRLDFPAALARLEAALADDPGAADLLGARAQLHQAMRRPSLALADLDRALQTAPDDPDLAAARAAILAQAGASEPAAAPIAPPAAPDVAYDPAMLMAADFRVVEGAMQAPEELVFLHGAADLDRDAAELDLDALARAVAAGKLRVVHLFTYSGRDSAIWGALAMICAGPEAQAPLARALSAPPARAAFTALDATANTAPLQALVVAAYGAAGLDPSLVDACVFDRGHALRYLADWGDKYRAIGWRGRNFYDVWPFFALNGTPLSAEALSAQLLAWAPAPAPEATARAEPAAVAAPVVASVETAPMPEPAAPEPTAPEASAPTEPPAAADPVAPTPGPIPGAPPPAMADLPDPEPTAAGDAAAPVAPAPDMAAAPIEAVPETAAAAPEPEKATEPAPRATAVPRAAGDLRLARDLKGIFAPSLAQCLVYLDGIATPTTLDGAWPAPNRPDAGPLGTTLFTSQGLVLFDTDDTICDLTSGSAEGLGDSAAFACHDRASDAPRTALRATRLEPDGLVPRLTLASADTATDMRQCVTLGQLGLRFAPLWRLDDTTCQASAPLTGAQLTFHPQGGTLVVEIVPRNQPAAAETARIAAALDGIALTEADAPWTGAAWQLPLGPFDASAKALSDGLFFTLTGAGRAFELPLLGSGAAMAALAACAAE